MKVYTEEQEERYYRCCRMLEPILENLGLGYCDSVLFYSCLDNKFTFEEVAELMHLLTGENHTPKEIEEIYERHKALVIEWIEQHPDLVTIGLRLN